MDNQELKQIILDTEKKWIDKGLLYNPYLTKNINIENILSKTSIIKFIYNFLRYYKDQYDSINAKTNQTETGITKRRSIEDVYRFCKYYYPDTNLFEIIDCFYTLGYNKVPELVGIQIIKCPDIMKIVARWVGNYDAIHYKYSEMSEDTSFSEPMDICTIDLAYCQGFFQQENEKLKKEQEKMNKKVIVPVIKKGGFRISVRSRHPSHSILRTTLPKMPFRTVFRLGSTTELENTVEKGGTVVEINTTDAVRNSASKYNMKVCFTEGEVKTADWYVFNNNREVFQKTIENDVAINKDNLPYPLIGKSLLGSRGVGNTLIKDKAQLLSWMQNRNPKEYILEKYYTYSREYRLHVTEDGCFYTCRKMLKCDTPDDKKYQRHDDNCVWILENNPSFDKPVNWDLIVEDCVKALKSLGLDIAAFDVKVQSAKTSKGETRKNPEWIVIESCSAPSFGKVTAQKYNEIIPIVATKKAQSFNLI